MLEGRSSIVDIGFIYVDRAERQRAALTNIEELAASIAKNGLIHFPVIERDGKLRVGERRWTACKQLGWTQIPVQFVDELDEAGLQELELEENIKRVNLSWQEECRAVARYHELKRSQHEDWTDERTAEALGMSRTFVTQKLAVADKLNDGRVVEAPKFSTAINIVRRQKAREAANVIEEIQGIKTDEKVAPLLNEDFIAWQRDYSGPKFNFIHCDFPYGVNADKHDQGSAITMGGYEDTFDTYQALLAALAEGMSNVVSESAHLMFWFSMDYYQFTLECLGGMGWRVNPFPLIWYKSDNSGILPDPRRGPRRVYETAFMASCGDRPVVQPVSNVFAHGVTKEIHMSEKPRPMLKHFFRMFVDENSLVLDPTCGSGNALRVATESGAKFCLGLERNVEFYELAKEHFYDI